MLHAASTHSLAKKPEFLRAEAELALLAAREAKAERLKDVGAPIALAGKALQLEVRGRHAWVAENTAVVRVVDLESGKTVQLYKGHTAPCTCIAFYDTPERKVLISGAWDKTIRLWDTTTRAAIATTEKAHGDFVKTLLVIPELKLLVSGSSDKIVRFWDLSKIEDGVPLRSAGSISSHTRPVEALALGPVATATGEATLFTADTMGVIRAWTVARDDDSGRWRATLAAEPPAHRTGVADMWYGQGYLYTASLDESVFVTPFPAPPPGTRVPPALVHAKAVRCVLPLGPSALGEPYVLTGAGDAIRAYDVADADAPVLLADTDAHAHDVTALRLWARDVRGAPEAWVVSASLDGTLRRWKLADLLRPQVIDEALASSGAGPAEADSTKADGFALTEDEERELAELMGDD